MIRKLALILIISGFILILASQINSGSDRVEWKNYRQALDLAKKDDKLIFIYFYSESCEYCRAMSDNVFSDEHIAKILNKDFVPAKVNVMTDSAIVKKFIPIFKEKKVYFVTPSYIILDSNERIIDIKNGYLEKKEFENFIININK